MRRSNLLGDIRAENDTEMLDLAFFETSDYKTLLDSNDRCVIVGRRGTGKSALVHKLYSYWDKQNKIFVINIAPEEDQIIGLRSLFKLFGENFVHIKAGSKIAWKYALYMEIASKLDSHYKFKKILEKKKLSQRIGSWGKYSQSISTKLRTTLKIALNPNLSPEDNIAELSYKLELDSIESDIIEIIKESSYKIILLIDRLDEGYTPDYMGVALVDGFVQSVIDLNSKFKKDVRGLVFLRDNMYRSIAINDPDFTRNIEGQVLRLHWDEYGLFNLVCNRLRIINSSTQENSTKIWNSFASRELTGRDGFKIALRLTLYRPRDILALLNNAFLHALSQERKEIILDDIDSSAKSISDNRLNDLKKEYEIIFPALNLFISTFSSGSPEITVLHARELVQKILLKDDHEIEIQRDISILEDADQILQRLYGVGFLGIYDEKSSAFIFCHDGRPSKEITENSRVLIHPCYWLSLNLNEKDLDSTQADEIYDEYDITISSITKEQRLARIGRILEEIKHIEKGHSGSHEFEAWCLEALKLIFAGTLSNIELHPNKNGRQQRDIVATNMATLPVWKRILKDYDTRQVIFEVKNYDDLSGDEYRQMNTYLSSDYGRLGFIITRCLNNNLEKGKDLDWTQELYFHHKKIVIKISETYLIKYLSKLRSPQKHDGANIELNKLLDTYIRQYLIIKIK